MAVQESDTLRRKGLLDILQGQIRVLHALMIRAVMTRFGRENIGFVWLILESVLLTAGVTTMYSFKRGESNHGINIITFIVSGYMMITLWRHMSSGAGSIRRNMNLMYHRRITILDNFIARSVVELASTTSALILIYAFLVVASIIEPVDDYRLVLAGWIGMALMAISFGIVMSAITEMWEVVEHFVPPMQYLIIPTSGVFFMLDWLPPAARDILVYNPLTNAIEMFRAGFLGEGVKTYYDIGYLYTCSLAGLAIGLTLVDGLRHRINFTR